MARFPFQCRETSNDDSLKLRFFPSSLPGQALTWYVNLPPNSIHKKKGRHAKSVSVPLSLVKKTAVSMADLARWKEEVGETAEQFIRRFTRAFVRCQVNIPESDFVQLAGLRIEKEVRRHGCQGPNSLKEPLDRRLYSEFLRKKTV